MKRLFFFAGCLIFVLCACESAETELAVPTEASVAETATDPTVELVEPTLEPAEPTGEAPPTVAVGASTVPDEELTADLSTPTSIPEPTAEPTAEVVDEQVVDGPPEFGNIRFATEPNGESQAIFPPGTQEVYALWDYMGMTAEIEVRRKWRWPNEAFERAEVWDVTSYGVEGTVDDIFIYDYESEQGLEQGLYSFDLFIDGLWAGSASFYVHGDERVVDPVSGRVAYADNMSQLIVEEADGSVLATLNGFEFENLVWLQDGRYLMYREVDRREYVKTLVPWAIVSNSWLFNPDTGSVALLGQRLGHEQFTSDLRYLAAERGSGFADACGIDLVLQFSMLNENGAVVAAYEPADFDGFPADWTVGYYPKNGYWESDTDFVVDIAVLCDPFSVTGEVDEEVEKRKGVYRFSLDTLQAERIGDLREETE